jgi:putative Mn2+ efflux pump MntP
MYTRKFFSNFIDKIESIINFNILISLGSIPDKIYTDTLKFSTSEKSLDIYIFNSEMVNLLIIKARL